MKTQLVMYTTVYECSRLGRRGYREFKFFKYKQKSSLIHYFICHTNYPSISQIRIIYHPSHRRRAYYKQCMEKNLLYP
jgi:hypothetical protein